MALSQRCFSAQPAFPWGNACMGSLEGKNPTSTPPGQGRIAPGCFDLERSAPLGWDQGQTRGPDGSRGRGGNPSPPRSTAASCFAGSRQQVWHFPSHQQTHLPLLATGRLPSSGTQNRVRTPVLRLGCCRPPALPVPSCILLVFSQIPGTTTGRGSTKHRTHVPRAALVPSAHAAW